MDKLLAAVMALLLCLPAVADEDDPDAPPAAAPENFSGAVGKYRLSASAAPTEVAVEDPLKLTVRITGSGPKNYLPRRAQLHLFPPEMRRDFYVEDLPQEDRSLPAERAWEFVYRLRPKRLDVKRIPPLEFVYYDPGLRRFQPARTRGLPLKVVPRAQAELPKAVARVPLAPERFYEIATGETVLARSRRAGGLYPLLLAVLVMAPPGICAVWYVVWRRLHPEAGWRVRRRRSRAARAALGSLDGQATGEHTAAVLAGYLRQRLELTAAEPTPVEVAAHLARAGVSGAIADRVATLFRACDADRFSPSPPAASPALSRDARDLIQALEGELCAS